MKEKIKNYVFEGELKIKGYKNQIEGLKIRIEELEANIHKQEEYIKDALADANKL